VHDNIALAGRSRELATDILRTATPPSWTEIGQLGAIAALRTFLDYFLERDVESVAAKRGALQDDRWGTDAAQRRADESAEGQAKPARGPEAA
jgi:hypothetical protein